MLLGRDPDIAAQIGQDAAQVLAVGQLLLQRDVVIVTRGIELALRDDGAFGQVLLTIIFALVEVDADPVHLDLGQSLLVAGAQGVNVVARALELRLGLGIGDAERLVVDAKQELAGLDRLVLDHGDLGDSAGDLGADRDLVGTDIGVVDRHIAAAGGVEIGADHQHQDRPEQHEDGTHRPARRLLPAHLRLVVFGRGDLLEAAQLNHDGASAQRPLGGAGRTGAGGVSRSDRLARMTPRASIR